MNEFLDDNEITKVVSGKTIKKIKIYDNYGDDYLQLDFFDGAKLRFRYDWIYGWETGTVFEDTEAE